ncbi:hypothetical protein RJ639_045409 [Escallonia herrerae]|uniref:Uncharacterized protein n=1 Tax=Escallonia herrerae TaxID=1293975 RepID=A0AA88WAY3_9ASTE|nr:hypothetical protein RJ639_045409 [Escallonia herrerae]
MLFILSIFGTKEIKNQVYDDNQNTITIIVVCCNPEKIRDMLCCKGRKLIKSIEIKEPGKPNTKDIEKKPNESVKSKASEKPNDTEKQKVPEKKDPEKTTKTKDSEKSRESEKHKTPVLVPIGYLPFYPHGLCCGPCSEGYVIMDMEGRRLSHRAHVMMDMVMRMALTVVAVVMVGLGVVT